MGTFKLRRGKRVMDIIKIQIALIILCLVSGLGTLYLAKRIEILELRLQINGVI